MPSALRHDAPRPPFSFTLLELIVVLVLLGIVLALAPVAFPRLRPADPEAEVAAARRRSAREGRAVPLRRHAELLLALPDGSVIGAGRDLVTGAAADSLR